MEMDFESFDDSPLQKRCYTINRKVFLGLNLVYNPSNCLLLLWNKYQVFIYEKLTCNEIAFTLIPDYRIQQILLTANYIICHDVDNFLHLVSLKFKRTASELRCRFEPKDKHVEFLTEFGGEHALCLKYHDNTYSLNLHKISKEFELKKTIKLTYSLKDIPQNPRCLYILKCSPIPINSHGSIKNYFTYKKTLSETDKLVLVSFDSLTLYACLFNPLEPDTCTDLVKLYESPLQICDVQVEDNQSFSIIVGLKMGTIINLSFDRSLNSQIIHLNTSIQKFLVFNNNIVYTNGTTMWRYDDAFSQSSDKMQQLFIQLVKDFIKIGDQFVCVTYSNCIYTFFVNDCNVYITSLNDKYYEGNTFLKSSQQYELITDIVKNNMEIADEIENEGNYITALALANRPDVIKDVIQYEVISAEKYQEIIADLDEYIITNEINEYFDTNIILFLIKLLVKEKHKLNKVVSCLLEDLKLNVTFTCQKKVLKTVTIGLPELKNKTNFILPLKHSIPNVGLKIKLVLNLPGIMDKKQKHWVLLSKTDTSFNSEHFIESSNSTNVNFLKQPGTTLKELVLMAVEHFHRTLFKFEDKETAKKCCKWSFYLLMPNRQIFNKIDHTRYQNKTKHILQHLSSSDFLEKKEFFRLKVMNDEVKIQLIDDEFSGSYLKIVSSIFNAGYDIRSFLSDVFYRRHTTNENNFMHIPHSNYANAVDLRGQLTAYLSSQELKEGDLIELFSQYQERILRFLPL